MDISENEWYPSGSHTGRDSCLSGLNEEKEKIIRLFGPKVCPEYKLE
jgi:hypothetical protein